MAPEIIQGNPYDKSVDWFAYGVLVHELISGHGPFYAPGHDELQTYENVVQNKITWSKYVSSSAKSLVKGLIAPHPASRFAFADVKRHRFYNGMKWEKMANVQIQAPYIPPPASDIYDHTSTSGPVFLADMAAAEKSAPDCYRDVFADF